MVINADIGTNLLTCPDCRGIVSRRAPACPHCGCPMQFVLAEHEKNNKETSSGKENLQKRKVIQQLVKVLAQVGASKKTDDNIKVIERKNEERTSLIGACVLNYDSRCERVIAKIEDSFIFFRGGGGFRACEFLGHFKFLNPKDKVLFYKLFSAEINVYKEKKAEEEKRMRQNMRSMNYLPDESTDYLEDFLERDFGPDGIVETYLEYHCYD